MSTVPSESLRDSFPSRGPLPPEEDGKADKHSSGQRTDNSPLKSLGDKLLEARTDLLDLTLRNNMLNFHLPKRHGLNLHPRPLDELFTRLVRQHEAIRFTSTTVVETDSEQFIDEDAADRTAYVNTRNDEFPGKSTDHSISLSAPYTSDQLQNRLLQTFRTARSYIEEQGANTLFLAMGFLEWYEGEASDKSLMAPLVLVPVELERDAVRDQFMLKYTDEEVVENLSLIYRMKSDFRIDLPALDMGDADDGSISDYIAKVKNCVTKQKRWTVHEDKLVLGFFSFGKYLMFHDLDLDLWPEAANPLNHNILSALLGDGFREEPSDIEPDTRLDDVLPMEDVRTVLDADSSQLTAVVDVARGRNLVIQGPPGTGKSQTITNIIARTVMDGKSVLFVAEKMAALEVVKSRLERVGLGAACLELHSNKTNKRQLLLELERTWQLRGEASREIQSEDQEYQMQRKKLNEYTDAVHHRMGQSGVTPYQAMGTLVSFQDRAALEAWPAFDVDINWSHEQFVHHRALLSDLQAFLSELGVPERHPFWGCDITELPIGEDKKNLVASVANAVNAVDAFLREWLDRVAKLNMPLCETCSDVETGLAVLTRLITAPNVTGVDVAAPGWREQASALRTIAQAMREIHELHAKHDARLLADTWRKDLSGVRARIVAHPSIVSRLFSGDFKAARTEALACLRIPQKQSAEEILSWVSDVIDVQEKVHQVMRQDALLRALLGSMWRSEESDWAVCSDLIEWMTSIHDFVANDKLPAWILPMVPRPGISADAGQCLTDIGRRLHEANAAVRAVADRLEFQSGKSENDVASPDRWTRGLLGGVLGDTASAVLARVQTWQTEMESLSGIVRWNLYVNRCEDAGLASLPSVVSTWAHASTSLADAFRFRWYEALLQKVFQEHPILAQFAGSAHWNTVERFRALDDAMTEATQRLAARAHIHRMPTREAGGGELGVLRREMQKKARHMPIRKLLEQAGHAIQGIKPVFMASPLSVATFVPPGSLHFDLVVFDEASQVLPTDAFGALLRGRQLVVVGDSKQLPPTNFFDVSMEDDDESEEAEMRTSDMESILGLCVSQGMPERMLRWHYRSRHESLISVSNSEFYDGRLVVFPSPERTSDASGLVLHRLENTAYDRGKTRTNRLEARAVAEAVLKHAMAYVAGETNETLGVVAFSSAQAGAIEDEVDRLRRQHPETEAIFSGLAESFFVKNLETVQGDERDIILISVGYGRDSNGYLAMSFGPLGKAGGERRLNVLITRARVRCEVFTNLRADDIDLHRAKGEGTRIFKEFLKYCETGILDLPHSTDREMDSPFEVAVRDELTRLGYGVDTQVGSAGFFIDLAVIDPDRPGRYLLGIECDGRTYHSSRSARDRDRLRQQVLEGLGWKLHRIWSTDWFRDKRNALDKVVAGIEKAKQQAADGMGKTSATAKTRQVDSLVESERPNSESSSIAASRDVPAEVVRLSSAPITVPYTVTQLDIGGSIPELHAVPVATMAGWIRKVVEIESPVHVDVVARRITDACGVKRIGKRIQATFDASVSYAVRRGYFEQRGEFLFKAGQTDVPLRNRGDLGASEKKMAWISHEEISGVILALIDRAYGYAEDDLLSDASRELGFQRMTQEMREVITEVLSALYQGGRIKREGVNYVKG